MAVPVYIAGWDPSLHCYPTNQQVLTTRCSVDQRCPEPYALIYLQMSEIDLLIFDEAHHAVKRHPYNLVMREFYHQARNLKFLKLISLPSPLQLSLFRVS